MFVRREKRFVPATLPRIEVLSLRLPTSDTATIPMYTPSHAIIIIIIIIIDPG